MWPMDPQRQLCSETIPKWEWLRSHSEISSYHIEGDKHWFPLMTIHQSKCYLDILWIFTMSGVGSSPARILGFWPWIDGSFAQSSMMTASRPLPGPGGPGKPQWCWGVPEAVDICGYNFYSFFQGWYYICYVNDSEFGCVLWFSIWCLSFLWSLRVSLLNNHIKI